MFTTHTFETLTTKAIAALILAAFLATVLS